MSLLRPGATVGLFLLLLGMACGCSRPPYSSTSTTTSRVFVSRDGMLHYRLPIGWFDATADSQAVGHEVLLLRSDYAATIAVNEIRVDAQARRQLERGGLLQLAQLTMGLAGGGTPVVLQQSPELFVLNGRQFCAYELIISGARDVLRVVLFDTGTKVYAVHALVPGDKARNTADDVFAVQQDFLDGLRW